ncbi:response regulator transcription factor [Virgibacillus sp. LDC1]|uniref:response regulator transcription factor n=1 Tax=Paenibacillus TaxID=44249 RepID=UPI000C26E726|nr:MULTISPECIES: response regulator transcription factor [Paenibacillus]MCV4231030.1 response regulator transcription factor [Virgibacillus sp. LDC1]MEC0307497.1 response regulator transcription factor [Paenibacillus lautus]PJN54921.1 Transcriptional regulatory protein YycF [Paenibacillus sp. GM2FR]
MDCRLLLVDDETGLLDMLNYLLTKEGFKDVTFATTAQEALDCVHAMNFDLIVLDIMLPDLDGFELCRRLREVTSVPILFLTARTLDMDKIMGLTIGGDDYITKPFNPLEVVARIKAQLRRKNMSDRKKTNNEVYDFGAFQLYKQEGRLMVNRQEINCPAKEFELLLFLCENPNQIFSVSHLYERIWGMESFGEENTVMVHIRRLRQKIEINPNDPKWIVNIRGMGYKLLSSPKGSN